MTAVLEILGLAVFATGIVAASQLVLRWIRLRRGVGYHRSIEVDELRRQLGDLEALLHGRSSQTGAKVEPPSNLKEPRPPEALVQSLSHRHCVLFAGVGVRAQAGYPGYAELLWLVIDHFDTGGGPWQALREQLQAGQIELVADLLRHRLEPDVLLQVVRDCLTGAESREASAVQILSRLPFAGVITDDWSGYIARMFRRPDTRQVLPWTLTEFEHFLRGRQRFIVEAYGGVNHGRLVLGFEDYQAIVDEFRDYRRFMTSLLLTRSSLFIGVNLEDIEQFLSTSGARLSSRQDHWALVRWRPDIELQAERLRERFGLTLLVYPGEHELPEVAHFIRMLDEQMPTQSEPSRFVAPNRPDEEPTLTALRLENIGPFTEFSLDFQENHTILLGDNSSGKTSILRSVALGLAGDTPETQQLAQRLLKTDSSSGAIELTSGHDVFRTELRRERGRVQVTAPRFTPVQAGMWLAIGFPPVRGLSLSNPQGPVRQPVAGACPEDLLPLLRNSADTRLDDLKQWVVNTELREDDGEVATSDRRGRLLEEFFGIVGELMPGIKFTYTDVDRKTFDVMLASPDGTITFDLLSRGMTAVLGWIGVLLQRMYEVYADDVNPSAQPVLVLVDEIDVHLHPEWQRSILPLLRRRFPRMHLLATTHSPLIVSSAADAEIFHIARNPGEPLHATRLGRSFTGVSPDEVLTSSAFAMGTPLDLDTDEMLSTYMELLARGRTPENDSQAEKLAKQLGEPWIDRTPYEAHAANLLREWLVGRLADEPEEQRIRIFGEAQRYLNRLRAGGE